MLLDMPVIARITDGVQGAIKANRKYRRRMVKVLRQELKAMDAACRRAEEKTSKTRRKRRYFLILGQEFRAYTQSEARAVARRWFGFDDRLPVGTEITEIAKEDTEKKANSA